MLYLSIDPCALSHTLQDNIKLIDIIGFTAVLYNYICFMHYNI